MDEMQETAVCVCVLRVTKTQLRLIWTCIMQVNLRNLYGVSEQSLG